MENKSESKVDILGLAPYGETLNTIAKGTLDGLGAFLSRICLPAAEEFGLLLRDKVSNWRANNAIKITQKAEKLLLERKDEDLHGHPKIIMKIIDDGSWAEDDFIQNMWAGLLASSCSKDGTDETNLIFINTLTQLTKVEIMIVNFSCRNSIKKVTNAGWLMSEEFIIPLEKLIEITNVSDFHRLDWELDHLRTLNLIGDSAISGGFDSESTDADITPTAFSLQMFARCNGSTTSVIEYYDISK